MEMTSERSKQIDTGAGFYLNEDDYIEEKKKEKIVVETPCKILENWKQLALKNFVN